MSNIADAIIDKTGKLKWHESGIAWYVSFRETSHMDGDAYIEVQFDNVSFPDGIDVCVDGANTSAGNVKLTFRGPEMLEAFAGFGLLASKLLGAAN